MTAGKRMAALFDMDDATWRRHANPWSVWSRTTVLPLLLLAAWSRIWIGGWAVIPGAVALLWTWINPRLFGEPASFDAWAAKAVMGERIWINRDDVPVPAHHRVAPNVLNVVSGVGSLFAIWGAVDLALWPALFGLALVYAGKLWFLDRMVWLYEDMHDATEAYRALAQPLDSPA